MAGVTGSLRRRRPALLAGGLATLALLLPAAPARPLDRGPGGVQVRWYAPVRVDGKVFPLLRSGERWLNWRDNYGDPRMRLQPDGTWRQVGVHQGVDVYAEKGSPVASMTAGVVEAVGWTFYSGWRVGVRGADGRYYFYAHLSAFASGLEPGRRVSPGAILGRVGSSGYGPEGTADEFPPHLHLGIQAGRWENPQPLLESLYRGYVDNTRALLERVRSLERRSRLLRLRAHVPGSPGAAALPASLEAAAADRAAAERLLYVLI